MSRGEARTLLTKHLARYRAHPYSRLVELVGSVETEDVRAIDGILYQLEVEFFWDDKENGNVRVLAAIDGGDISAVLPMTESFIKAASGDYLGE